MNNFLSPFHFIEKIFPLVPLIFTLGQSPIRNVMFCAVVRVPNWRQVETGWAARDKSISCCCVFSRPS